MTASPYLLLTLTALFWASNFVVGRALHGAVPPIALAFWRWAIALVILLPFAARQAMTDRVAIRRHWRLIAALGILGIGVFNTLIYVALGSTTATNALLLNSTIPVVIVILSWLFLGQALSRTQAGGVALSLAGVLVIVFHGEWSGVRSLRFNPGDVWIFVAAVVWAVYTILLRRRPVDVHPLAFLLVTIWVGLVVIAPFYAIEYAWGARMQLTWGVAGALLYVGILPSVVANIFWNQGVTAVGANRTGVFIHLMPVFGTCLAVGFLDEVLHLYHVAGIVLILLGIVLVTRPTPR